MANAFAKNTPETLNSVYLYVFGTCGSTIIPVLISLFYKWNFRFFLNVSKNDLAELNILWHLIFGSPSAIYLWKWFHADICVKNDEVHGISGFEDWGIIIYSI